MRLQSRPILGLCTRSKDEVRIRLADYCSHFLSDPLQLGNHVLHLHRQYHPPVQAQMLAAQGHKSDAEKATREIINLYCNKLANSRDGS